MSSITHSTWTLSLKNIINHLLHFYDKEIDAQSRENLLNVMQLVENVGQEPKNYRIKIQQILQF